MTVHHIQGIKKDMADYISRNNFDALIGESSEGLTKEAFQRMDVQLDLSMRHAGVLEGWSLRDYHAEYKCVLNCLSDGLEARLVDGDRWYKENQYLYYEDRIVVTEARLDGCLQWAHLSSGHTGCNKSVDFFFLLCASPRYPWGARGLRVWWLTMTESVLWNSLELTQKTKPFHVLV